MTAAAAAQAYESVRRRSSDLACQPKLGTALLPIWLAFVAKVVVVGGFAFGAGFLGVLGACTSVLRSTVG